MITAKTITIKTDHEILMWWIPLPSILWSTVNKRQQSIKKKCCRLIFDRTRRPLMYDIRIMQVNWFPWYYLEAKIGTLKKIGKEWACLSCSIGENSQEHQGQSRKQMDNSTNQSRTLIETQVTRLIWLYFRYIIYRCRYLIILGKMEGKRWWRSRRMADRLDCSKDGCADTWRTRTETYYHSFIQSLWINIDLMHIINLHPTSYCLIYIEYNSP